MLIYNAVGGAFGKFLGIDPKALAVNFQVNTMPAVFGAAAAPGDGRGRRTGHRCKRQYLSPAGKTSLRGFSFYQSGAEDTCRIHRPRTGTEGCQCCLRRDRRVIDPEWTRGMTSKPAGDALFVRSSATTEEIRHVVHQDRSAWSFNVEVRPFRQTW